MTGEEGGGENCHPLITSLLNEGAVIKKESMENSILFFLSFVDSFPNMAEKYHIDALTESVKKALEEYLIDKNNVVICASHASE